MTTDMAQWSETAPLQAAIEQLLETPSGLQPAQLTEQLPPLADACFEAGWSGSADLLGLLTELLEAEDPESEFTPEQQQHLQALFSLLPSASRAQPSEEQLSTVLSILSGTDWQSPLDPEDLETLPELLQDDWQRAASNAPNPINDTAVTDRSNADIEADISVSGNEDVLLSLDDLLIEDDADEEQPQTLTLAEADTTAADPIESPQVESPQALAERLQAEAEPLAELDNPLPSDLAALVIELIDSCEDPELPIIGEAQARVQALTD